MDKFSFNENNDQFNSSFGNDNGINEENNLDNFRSDKRMIMENVNDFDINPFSESKKDFTSGFHSIAPKKTQFMVPSYIDECRFISYYKILCG